MDQVRSQAVCGVVILLLLTSSLVVVSFAHSASVQTDGVIATMPGFSYPAGIAFDSADGNVYVANFGSGTLSVITGSTDTLTATVKVGADPYGVACDTLNGDIYVSDTSGNVSVVNGSTNAVVATVHIGGSPRGVAFDSANGEVYVANDQFSGSVSVVNGSTNERVATIPVNSDPYGVAFDAANGEIYVTNTYTDDVSAINGSTNVVVATLQVGQNPVGVAVDSASGDVLVANANSGDISVINGSAKAVVGDVHVGGSPSGVAFDSADGSIYVTNDVYHGTVFVVRVATEALVANVPVGSQPVGIAFDSANGDVYVANYVSGTVSVIGTTTTSQTTGSTTASETTTAPTVPSGVLYYIPITLTNSQYSATPAPFQQMITLNSDLYSAYEAPNLQNVEFFNSAGEIIPSWLESGNTNSSANTVYWLHLAQDIPADANAIVYMGFANPSVNLFNSQTTGEAPELSPAYGQYDDGPRVFSKEWNFTGPSLPTGWNFTQGNSGDAPGYAYGGYTVDDGASFLTGACGYTMCSNSFYAYYDIPLAVGSYIISTDMNTSPPNGFGVWFGWWSDPQSPEPARAIEGSYVADYMSCESSWSCHYPFQIVSSGGVSSSPSIEDAYEYMTYRLYWIGDNQTGVLQPPAGQNVVISQWASSPPQGDYYVGFWDGTEGQGNNGENVQWVTVSAMPPNGVMPSVLLGSVSAVPTSSSGEVFVTYNMVVELVVAVVIVIFACVLVRRNARPTQGVS